MVIMVQVMGRYMIIRSSDPQGRTKITKLSRNFGGGRA